LNILTIKGRIQALNNSRVSITNCEIINEATINITSLYAYNNSEITVENTIFIDNSNVSSYANTVATCLNNSRIHFEITDDLLGDFTNKYESIFNIQNNSRISVNHTVDFTCRTSPTNTANPYYINVSGNSDLIINSNILAQAIYFPGADQTFLNVEKNSRCTMKNATTVELCSYSLICSYHSSIVMQGTLNINGQFPITAINSGDILLQDVQIGTGSSAYLVSQNQSKIRVQNSFFGSGSSLAAVYLAIANSQIMLTDGTTAPIPTLVNCQVGPGALAPNNLVTTGAGAGCVINYL
jgi:uncharacterized protein YcfL